MPPLDGSPVLPVLIRRHHLNNYNCNHPASTLIGSFFSSILVLEEVDTQLQHMPTCFSVVVFLKKWMPALDSSLCPPDIWSRFTLFTFTMYSPNNTFYHFVSIRILWGSFSVYQVCLQHHWVWDQLTFIGALIHHWAYVPGLNYCIWISPKIDTLSNPQVTLHRSFNMHTAHNMS